MWVIIAALLAVFAAEFVYLLKIRRRKQGAAICIKGEYKGAKFIIPGDEEITIGTDAAFSNVVLMADTALSRKHCGISFEKGRYYVTEYSANGTYKTGGKRLSPNRREKMYSGDSIYLGDKRNIFRLK